MPLPWDAKVLVGILGVSGTLHLVKPETYEPLMPEFVPGPPPGHLRQRGRRAAVRGRDAAPAHPAVAGYATAALLVVVFPGNLKMADDARRSRSTRFKQIAYARLPLQAPMVRAALRAARTG